MTFFYFYCLILYFFLNLFLSFFLLSDQQKIFVLKKYLKNEKFVKLWFFLGIFIIIFREQLEQFLYNQTESSLNNLDLHFFFKIDKILYDFLKKYFVNLNLINKKKLKKLLKNNFILLNLVF